MSLGAGLSVFEQPLGLPPSFADLCTDVQCRGLQTQHQQTDWFAYTLRRMFLITSIFPQSEMLRVIIGVGGSRDTIWEDVVVKIDSTPTSLSGFNMLDTNDNIEELSCGSSGLTGVRIA
uniref:Uncharacterized protein n=1 Tax=Tanacetum cinerariifolium TaxID=118510 RepID=A0A699RVX0_TANCI|nr:hypothetical protein [Tanacetum cinerariifolium]